MLNNPVYYWYKPLRDVLKCPFTVETGEDRKSVTVRMADFVPKEQIKLPNEATHFRFCLSVGVVWDRVYDKDEERFIEPYGNEFFFGCCPEFKSEWIPKDAHPMGDLTFSISLDDTYQLKDDMTVLRCFGIVFGKMLSEVEPLKKDRGSIEFLGAI